MSKKDISDFDENTGHARADIFYIGIDTPDGYADRHQNRLEVFGQALLNFIETNNLGVDGNIEVKGNITTDAKLTALDVDVGNTLSVSTTTTTSDLLVESDATVRDDLVVGDMIRTQLITVTGNGRVEENLTVVKKLGSGSLEVTNEINSGGLNVNPGSDIDMGANVVKNVGEPSDDNHAATKLYVDNKKSSPIENMDLLISEIVIAGVSAKLYSSAEFDDGNRNEMPVVSPVLTLSDFSSTETGLRLKYLFSTDYWNQKIVHADDQNLLVGFIFGLPSKWNPGNTIISGRCADIDSNVVTGSIGPILHNEANCLFRPQSVVGVNQFYEVDMNFLKISNSNPAITPLHVGDIRSGTPKVYNDFKILCDIDIRFDNLIYV